MPGVRAIDAAIGLSDDLSDSLTDILSLMNRVFGMKLFHIDKLTIESIQANPFLPFLINFQLFSHFPGTDFCLA